jgi:potassium-transporting ATPase KdpC subunit
MRRQLLPALRMVLIMTVVLGLAYPLVVTLAAQGVFHDQANGSLVKVDGQVVGSKLLGQTFTSGQYFQGRPVGIPDNLTATGALGSNGQPGDPKDLALSVSGGSNYGPNNPDFLSLVSQRVAAYRKANGLSATTQVPVDAVTSSASGVDPEISVANARLQAPRVARARDLPLATVEHLVGAYTDSRSDGFLGDPGVNVLELNLALDRAAHP